MNNPLRKSLEFGLGGRIYRLVFVGSGELPPIDHDAVEQVLDIGEEGGPGSFRLEDITLHDAPATLQASTLSHV